MGRMLGSAQERARPKSPAAASTLAAASVPPVSGPLARIFPSSLCPRRRSSQTKAGPLILEFETGGRSGYNPHPEWPAAASGVTIGIGYDLRFNSRAVIAQDWQALPAHALNRLVDAQGLSGEAAQQRARELHDITVPWAMACDVFEHTTVVKFHQLCKHTWPGYDVLRAHSQTRCSP